MVNLRNLFSIYSQEVADGLRPKEKGSSSKPNLELLPSLRGLQEMVETHEAEQTFKELVLETKYLFPLENLISYKIHGNDFYFWKMAAGNVLRRSRFYNAIFEGKLGIELEYALCDYI